MADDDLDATIVARRPGRSAPPKRSGGPTIKVAALAVAAGMVVAAAFLTLRGNRDPSQPPISIAEPQPPQLAEADILAERSDTTRAVRFKPNPNILVLDFPNLTSQGQAFNRMAAFIEKRGLARDRVLNNQELADAVRADNATTETYYYGHDYQAADVIRFFSTADRQNLTLSPPEQDLRALLTQQGLFKPGADQAVISIPREGSDPFVDASGRASLLRHELSHGEFFTDTAYAGFVRRFWAQDMTEADRASFRGFLSRQGYDPQNEDLLANEAQAHLMNTTDGRYFNAPACGLPVDRVETLRNVFLAAMPAGWLHDAVHDVRPRLP